ncbi:MAG: fibronectin type III domain-containing protein [Acidobacteriota bacterium]
MKNQFISFFAIITVFISISCGKKGPVMPPVKKILQEVEIQEVFQRGDKIIIKWKNPQSYMDGSPLVDISKVEIWVYKKTYEEKEKQAVDRNTFNKQAVLLKSIQSTDFPIFRIKENHDSTVYRYEIAIEPSEYGRTLFFLGIKAVDKKRKKSDISETVSVRPEVVSCPPYGLRARQEKESVKLEWEPPKENTDGSSPACVEGYNLYRSLKEGRFDRINNNLIKETHYEDKGILFGQEYQYFVRSSASEDSPFLESKNSERIHVRVEDTIPPKVPQDLVVISGHDRITLTWDRVEDEDLKGYKVWRRIKEDENFSLLTSEAIKENIFNDYSAEKGIEYEYCVSACDRADNESDKSEVIIGILKGCVS